MVPCTSGVDLSSSFVPLASLSTTLSSSDHVVGFVDMEGQGDRSASYDVFLVTPVLLVSRVVLYNWRGPPNRNTQLTQLAILCNAALKIDRKSRGKAFGHLHVLLRDCDEGANEAKKILFDEEELTSAITDEDESRITSHNNVRVTLKMVFETITVWTVPYPFARGNTHENQANSSVAKPCEPAFTAKLAEIKTAIGKQLQSPSQLLGGTKVTGPLIARVVPEIVKKLNDNSASISPPDLLEAIHTKVVGLAHANVLEKFTEKSRKCSQTTAPLIMSPSALQQVLVLLEQKALKVFDSETANVPKSMVGGSRASLATIMTSISRAEHHSQVKELSSQLDRAKELAITKITEQIKKAKEQSHSTTVSAELEKHLLLALSAYDKIESLQKCVDETIFKTVRKEIEKECRLLVVVAEKDRESQIQREQLRIAADALDDFQKQFHAKFLLGTRLPDENFHALQADFVSLVEEVKKTWFPSQSKVFNQSALDDAVSKFRAAVNPKMEELRSKNNDLVEKKVALKAAADAKNAQKVAEEQRDASDRQLQGLMSGLSIGSSRPSYGYSDYGYYSECSPCYGSSGTNSSRSSGKMIQVSGYKKQNGTVVQSYKKWVPGPRKK